jgi:hypothetical protein
MKFSFHVNIFAVIFAILVGYFLCNSLFYFIYRRYIKENLRMQGSRDLRGDPDTAPSCGEHMGDIGFFPFNFGGSCPKVNRRMVME